MFCFIFHRHTCCWEQKRNTAEGQNYTAVLFPALPAAPSPLSLRPPRFETEGEGTGAGVTL